MMDAHGQQRQRQFRVIPLTKITLTGDPEFLIKDILPASGFAVLYGPPGSGKSFLALHMALCIAGGVPFFGCPVLQRDVVYVAAEAGNGFRKRVIAARQALGIDRGAPFFLVPDPPNLGPKSPDPGLLVNAFKQATLIPSVIVVDTCARTMAGLDENKPADVTTWMNNAAGLVRDCGGGLVLGVHHSGKDISKGMRGSSALNGGTDAEILVVKENGLHVANIEKMRDGGDDLTFSFKLERVVAKSAGAEAETCVVVPVTQPHERTGEHAKPSGPNLPGQARIALDALHEALREMGSVPPTSNHIPNGFRTVTRTNWRDYAKRRGLTESDDPEAFKKAFQRAMTTLQERRLIGVWMEHVWSTNVPGDGV